MNLLIADVGITDDLLVIDVQLLPWKYNINHDLLTYLHKHMLKNDIESRL